MKRLLILAVILAALAGCKSTTDSAELAKIQNEMAELKQVQRQVAIKVGLAQLVRPEVIPLSDEGIWIGSSTAEIVMIEYTDLHCPFCKRFQQEIWPSFKEQFVDTNKVAVLAREFPLASLHPKAPYAAVMLRCANEQGQYEPVKEQLFDIGNALNQQEITSIIKDNNLDEQHFNTCLENTDTHSIVTGSLKEAVELGLASTPAFILGRKQGDTIIDYEIVTGAKPLTYFSAVIERLSSDK